MADTHSKSGRLVPILIGAFIILTAGCAMFLVGAGAGAGAVAYAKGELQTVEAAKLDDVWNAALKTARELDYVITDTNKQPIAASFIARGVRDERLEVILRSETLKTTELGIRVGVMGDEERSRLILDRIRRHLRD